MGSKRFSTPPSQVVQPTQKIPSGGSTPYGVAQPPAGALPVATPPVLQVSYSAKLVQALKTFTQRFGHAGTLPDSAAASAMLPVLPADLFRATQRHQSNDSIPNTPQRLGVRISHPLALHYGEIAYQSLSKGDALRLRDQIEPAIVQYTFALSQDAQLAEAHAGLGHCHRRQGNIHRAIECFKRALAINPFLKFVQLDLAKSYTDLGKLDLAKKHYETAIKLVPTWVEARFGLALLLETEEAFLPAVDQYQQILQEEPDFLPAIHNLGHLHYRMGHYSLAIQQFQNSLTVSPGFPRALLGLAMALEKNGQLREALTTYHQLLAVRPNSHQLEFIKTRMEQLHQTLGRPVKKARKGSAQPADTHPKTSVAVNESVTVHLVRIK